MNREFKRKIIKMKNIFDKEKVKGMAIKTKFIQRERKFDSLKFLKFCVLSDDGICKDSLSKLCTELNKHEKISISTEGLNNKFTERSVEFLKEFLLDLIIKLDDIVENTLSSIKNKFKKIRIMDSTHHSLPDNFKNKYAGNGGFASEEAKELYKWMEMHAGLKGNYLFDKFFTTLEGALDNGVIDEIEEKNSLTVFQHFLNPEQIQKNDIVLNRKVCCLTGTFTNGTKADIEKLINSKGTPAFLV